jgi:hypothetical protein
MPPPRHALVLAAVVGCAIAAAACGQASAAAPSAAKMTPVRVAPPRTPAITGGSAAERALLRTIVREMRPSQIRALTIAPPDGPWHPSAPGDVEMLGTLTPSTKGHENSLGEWETWLVGAAFRDRSAELGLPRVLVVGEAGSGAQRVTGGARPPMAGPAGLPAFRRRVVAAAKASGARIVAVRVGVPDGYSADVTLQVSHPVPFLRRRLGQLQSRLAGLHGDGVFIAVYEADGRLLSVGGSSVRLSSGLGGVDDQRYASCGAMTTLGGGAALAPALPCPSTWRPPASTPPKRPVLRGWEAGGAATGEWNGRAGITVMYRPGVTGGLGLTLQNLNGHAITIDSIVPEMAAGGPIRYSGAQIQVPPSRTRPGTAGMLQAPYGREPAFAPVTVRPGDWIGVGLHFAVAHDCTAAIAGHQFTVDRTFVLTYRLQGKTVHRTYTSVPLNLTLPATCPGG